MIIAGQWGHMPLNPVPALWEPEARRPLWFQGQPGLQGFQRKPGKEEKSEETQGDAEQATWKVHRWGKRALGSTEISRNVLSFNS